MACSLKGMSGSAPVKAAATSWLVDSSKTWAMRTPSARGGARHRVSERQQSPGVSQELLTSCGQADVPAVAHEQGLAELVLQLANLFRQRRLADVEASGGTTEVEVIRDRHEVAHQPQLEVHQQRLPLARAWPGWRSPCNRSPGVTLPTPCRADEPLVMDRGRSGLGQSPAAGARLGLVTAPRQPRSATRVDSQIWASEDTNACRQASRRLHPRTVAPLDQLGSMGGAASARQGTKRPRPAGRRSPRLSRMPARTQMRWRARESTT